ncbi:hypothetical protein [Candidatus Amarolinea aalborgensis]|jgi:hypothetical protein|uniref:hypothetical protein n=1 Tax=Candidatus Amarolinea aalborgensis TaxID=2249329 RepID=UPI003BF96537
MRETEADLVVQVQELNRRLQRIEETLRRLESLLNTQEAPAETDVLVDLPQTSLVASPRLRYRRQAADFVMTVVRER